MDNEDGRDAEGELQVLGLVAEEVHAEEGSDAAADGRKKNKGSLGDAPFAPLGLPFVDAVEQEGQDVDDDKVVNEKSHCPLPRFGQFHAFGDAGFDLFLYLPGSAVVHVLGGDGGELAQVPEGAEGFQVRSGLLARAAGGNVHPAGRYVQHFGSFAEADAGFAGVGEGDVKEGRLFEEALQDRREAHVPEWGDYHDAVGLGNVVRGCKGPGGDFAP